MKNSGIKNMKFSSAVKTLIASTFCIFLAASLIFAPAKGFATGTGGAPGQFLSWGAGARSLAMGKAFLAISDDASATYWNPAAMTQIDRKEITALHATLFEDTSFDFISYVHPTPTLGVLGVNLTRLVSGGFEKISITIDPTSQEIVKLETLGEFSDEHSAYTLAYGRKFSEHMSVGLSAKKIDHTIDTFQQGFIAMDAALFAKDVFPHYRFALVAQNLVTQISGDTEDRLPLTIRFGNAYSLLRDRINIAFDVTQNSFAGITWNFGTEYWIVHYAALRLGMENRAGEIAETTAGLGLKYSNYSIDMALAMHDLGISQRVSASWRFGGSTSRRSEEEVTDLMEQGHEYFRSGNYVQAIQKFNQALDIDPSNTEMQTMVAKLQGIVTYLPEAPEGNVGRLVAQGVKSYMEGDLNTSYNAFRTAFDKDPQNAKLMNLTNRIAKSAGLRAVEPPRGPETARWTLVDQKLHDALQAIYEGRYDVAITKCDEVLRIEPENVIAIGRMGAAFFLMGEKDKAVALWKRALELDPTHKPAIEYLQQLGEYTP